MCDRGYFAEARRQAHRGCKGVNQQRPIDEFLPDAGTIPPTQECEQAIPLKRERTNNCRFNTRLTSCDRKGNKNPILRQLAEDSIAAGCAASGNALYVKAYRDLMRRESQLGGANMMQGSHAGAFSDYFPPGFCPGLSAPIHVANANDGCSEPAKPKAYGQDILNRYRMLRDMDYKLFNSMMIMGPHSQFPEFFPSDYNPSSSNEQLVVSKCKGRCGGNRVPGPLILDTKCAMADFIPQSYCAGWYLKQNARIPPYCLSSKLRGRNCSHLITVWK